MGGVRALVEEPLNKWRGGGPFYVILVIGRWAWPAHGPQMYCFYRFSMFSRYSEPALGCNVLC